MAALLAAFQRQPPGFHFVDVGANMALYSAICAVMFDPGRVVAFEPTPEVASIARRVLAANGISRDVGRVEQSALGDSVGTAPLYLSAVSDSSNSLVPGFKRSVGSVEVAVTTLDHYVDATATRPAVVKIDTESLEPAVIRGGRCTLQRLRPWLVVEVLNRRGRDYGIEVTEAMNGFDYSYYRLVSTGDWEAQTRIAGERGSGETNWLLTPDPIDDTFAADARRWLRRLSTCTVDRNPRTPLVGVAGYVFRREGMRGLHRRAMSFLRHRPHRESISGW